MPYQPSRPEDCRKCSGKGWNWEKWNSMGETPFGKTMNDDDYGSGKKIKCTECDGSGKVMPDNSPDEYDHPYYR
jgi:DnaJ-class molecular chaperone